MKKIKLLLAFARLFFQGKIVLSLRYIAYILGYQLILPKEIIRSIPVCEIDSKMVTIIGNSRMIITAPIPMVREEVFNMLHTAAYSIPRGYVLEILFAYRDLETQKRFWDEVYDEQSKLFPDASPEELKNKTRQLSAEPTGNGPHQTGGAVDVQLRKLSGEIVPMGTDYRGHSNKTAMFSKECTQEEKENRELLRTIMVKAGFWYYPGEWWHYCYGDQMWAAYTGAQKALYGPVIIS